MYSVPSWLRRQDVVFLWVGRYGPRSRWRILMTPPFECPIYCAWGMNASWIHMRMLTYRIICKPLLSLHVCRCKQLRATVPYFLHITSSRIFCMRFRPLVFMACNDLSLSMIFVSYCSLLKLIYVTIIYILARSNYNMLDIKQFFVCQYLYIYDIQLQLQYTFWFVCMHQWIQMCTHCFHWTRLTSPHT